MHIQPLTAKDKDHWHTLWQGYLDFYQTELLSATTENTWQKIIEENSAIFGFGITQQSNDVARYLYDNIASKTDFVQYRKTFD